VAGIASEQNGYSVHSQSPSSASPPTGAGQLWQELQPTHSHFPWDHSLVDASSASIDFSHLTEIDDIFTFTGNAYLPAMPTPAHGPGSGHGHGHGHGHAFPLPPTYPTQHLLPSPDGLALNAAPHVPPPTPTPMPTPSTVQIPGLNPRDQEYLRVEGCFELLPPHVLKPMMHMYFRMVHPNLPIVPEDHFWALWQGDDFRVGDYSFLLLRAMIFAATCVSQH
jgi:hypothetical protein